MRQAFVYRLYPSRTQERTMEAILTTTRIFYNSLLAERKQAWEERKERVTKVQQLRRVKERKATNPYAASVHSHILQVVADDLDKAFLAFFRRVRTGEKPGYPRFVRHEVAYSTVALKGRNRLFRQPFPTGTCVLRKRGV